MGVSLDDEPRSPSGVRLSFPTRPACGLRTHFIRVGTATAITIEIVEPEDGQTGFAVQPRRWVIERTLGLVGRCRRLARDHEATVSSALAFVVLAAAMLLVRRLARAL